MKEIILALVVAATVVPDGRMPGSSTDVPGEAVAARFLNAAVEPLTQFRGCRRVEASNSRFDKHGWLEAHVELSPESGFTFQVLAEGGSSYIRSKVLRPILDGEREIVAHGDIQRSTLTRDNYDLTGEASAEPGYLRLRLRPLRREKTLVDGFVLVTEADYDVVRVEGRLARNPSFWTRRVDIVRRYARVAGVRVPVSTESVAQVRIAGPSQVRVTYHYDMINGYPVAPEDNVDSPCPQ